MFITRGRTVGFIQLGPKTLGEAVIEALAEPGRRLVYYAPDGSQFYLEASAVTAACVAVTPQEVVRGEECLELLARRSGDQQGVIEVVELSEQQIALDVSSRPDSVIPGGLEKVRSVFAKHRQEEARTETAQRTAPSGEARVPETAGPATGEETETTPVAEPAPGPSGPPAGAAAGAGTEAVELSPAGAGEAWRDILRVRGLRLSGTFNVLAVAALAVMGREVDVRTGSKSCIDVLDDVLSLRRRLTMRCRGEGGEVYIYVDPGAGRIEAYYMEAGRAFLGAEALRRASRLRATEVKVYIDAGQGSQGG
ncbi:hypothetical protein [Pyrodictium abyssi]|uniref:Roadblock/LAMTOR2 domain-containing protein n=1 Tax=Pyrodictium abyssi TaxID=54256 RepID=A0ABN6ZLJ8_9CREN|nr:hypothetical protein PABY_07180 [Pyrodictium abyssi]